MLHSAIYLGQGKICHARSQINGYYDNYYNSGKGKIEITDWDKYLKFATCHPHKLIRLHPIIPYKHCDKIIEHLAKKSIEWVKKFLLY